MKIYKSKIEYGFLVAMFLLCVLPIWRMIINEEPLKYIVLKGGIMLLTLCFIFYLLFSIKYWIDGNTLKIRNSFIYKKDIDVFEIKSISKSKSLISSPAAAFDRIEINYRKYDSVLVSPKEKQLFIKELMAINPGIENKLI